MNDGIFFDYCRGLVAKVYKILPLFEEDNVGFFDYVKSLINELNGLKHVIQNIGANEEYISLLAVLNEMFHQIEVDNWQHKQVKQEVFKCIELVKRIQSRAKGDETR